MLRYVTTKLSVLSGGDTQAVILHVPPGETYTIKGFGTENVNGYLLRCVIGEDQIAKVWTNLKYGPASLFPLDAEVTGPENVIVGIQDAGGGARSMYVVLCYDDGK